ncbi:E3 SUMO-protein ligase SIZ1-like [Quillaja saponaria]|uniref:E3 SUMO-protein ligase SIZ1-like n=1 Tax=Quillaja saponaria TaxID=32244 RepID=A0AAD7KXT8_QUISA|nr:E3 SUMO-protein ligase SIZ1-like [Quillaja saponaria]KAJ7947781.1 E3 SUMO-protein ligase SIZ1-like [Quillaja saponaria]
MDLVVSCKEKLAYFRIKELKDVLTQLGLSKQGKKQDLVDRILSVLSDDQVARTWSKKNAVGKEQVAKLVDDTHRKMQISGATDLASKGQGVSDLASKGQGVSEASKGQVASDLASKGQGVSDSSNMKIKGEIDDSLQLDTKVHCLCGSLLETEPMIKCEDPQCHVWQHISCVIIPEKPMEGNPSVPDVFYCEKCRLSRADPFWVSIKHPLNPVKLTTASIPTDGTNPVQSIDRTFHLTRVDKDLLSKQEYDVQAWCMLLNDKVPFRMQWPQYSDLQVNGMPIRVISRPGSQLLGANGRDDGATITQYTRDGINKISLTGCDARIFCLGVRIVKRRTVQQIINLIPKDSDGERFEDALARVCRCVGGGNATDNADSDSDLEFVSDTFNINLRCPMSGSRMKIAGRFKPCVHMGCFDLEVFVEMNQRSRKWQCPSCVNNYTLENIIIDPYFNRITSAMKSCGEDVTEIEVKPDGSWRVKTRSASERQDLGDLAQWHFPDGTLCALTNGEAKQNMELSKQIKQEGVSESPNGLKLGIRKNRNGFWEVSKPEDMNACSGNILQENSANHEQKIIPMSSTATGSGKDCDDPSVNQDGGLHFDFSTNNGIEMDSLSLNVDSAFGFSDLNPSAAAGDAEVIVLSDSDEDNDILMSSGPAYNNNLHDASGVNYSVPPPGIAGSYPEDPTLGGSSCLGLFNANDDEFGLPLWPLPPGTHAGPGFQLFGSDADVSDPLEHLQHGHINCSSSMNGYILAPETAMGSTTFIPDSSAGHSDADLNDGLVDNPLAIAGDDPSLQIFLPTRPSDASMQPDLRDQADVSNGAHTEDWISLRLGGGADGSNGEPADPSELNPRLQTPAGEGPTDSLTDTASLLLGMNDIRSDKASRQRSDSPLSFPRQKRSVRPRLYLSIDSDSE